MLLFNRFCFVKSCTPECALAGSMVFSAVGMCRRMIGLRGRGLQCGRRTLSDRRCNPIKGMAQPTSRQGRLKRSEPRTLSAGRHVATPVCGSNTSPDLSIACMITASLRATATAARLKPILSRSPRPHVRRLLSALTRVRMIDAASYSNHRRCRSPHRETGRRNRPLRIGSGVSSDPPRRRRIVDF